MRTAKSVIEYFTNQTETGAVLPPEEWLKAAAMLTVLVGEEASKRIAMQSLLNKRKVELVEKYGTAAKAKIYIEATDEWAQCELQKAFIQQIEEFIRVSKKNAEISYKHG